MIEKAMKLLLTNYEKVKNAEYIQKPVSYALYQTWLAIDKVEKVRKKSEGKSKNSES